MSSSSPDRARDWLVAAGLYAAATLAFTWPLASVADRELLAPPWGMMTPLYQGDLLLIIWIQRWVMHALATNPWHLLDANAFHPVPHALLRSEHLLGTLPFFAAVYGLSGNPVLAQNVCVLLSFFLSGLFMHLLVLRWTRSHVAAYVGGLAFAFATWRIPEGLGRAHLLQAQYLPLVLLGLNRTATTGRVRVALATAALIALQALCSSYLTYHVLILAGAYCVADLTLRGVRGRRRAWSALALAVLPALGVVVAVTIPYARAWAHGELPAEALPPRILVPDVLAEWVGLGPAMLALGALPLLALARRDRARTIRVVTLLLVAAASWLVARARPPLFGLPIYDWLARVVPGMTHVRAPQRFGILTSFAASGLAALAVAAGLTALRRWGRLSWLRFIVTPIAVAAVLVPVTLNPPATPLPVPTGDDVPYVYRWLAEHGEGAPLLELPMLTPYTEVLTAGFVQYFSTYHWLPVLNGHTGYVPAQYPVIENLATQLPSAPALQLLVDCTGLRWIIDHDVSADRANAWNLLPVRPQLFGRLHGDVHDWLFEVRMQPRYDCARYFTRPDVTLEGNPLTFQGPMQGNLRIDGFGPRVFRLSLNQVLVTIENTGPARWPCTSVDPQRRVSFWASLSDADDTRLARWEVIIPRDLGPGEVVQVPLQLAAPSRPGTYELAIMPIIGMHPARGADPHLRWETRFDVVVPQ